MATAGERARLEPPGVPASTFRTSSPEVPRVPLPRRRRTGPASSLDLAAQATGGTLGAPPRSRVIPFIFGPTATARRTISTPLLIGPAIFRKFQYTIGAGVDPPNATIEVGWSTALVTEAGVALTVARPYTVLTERQNPFAYALATAGDGFNVWTVPNTYVHFEVTLDLIITEPRFCFTVSMVNPTASGFNLGGHALILEAVNPEALSTFLGS